MRLARAAAALSAVGVVLANTEIRTFGPVLCTQRPGAPRFAPKHLSKSWYEACLLTQGPHASVADAPAVCHRARRDRRMGRPVSRLRRLGGGGTPVPAAPKLERGPAPPPARVGALVFDTALPAAPRLASQRTSVFLTQLPATFDIEVMPSDVLGGESPAAPRPCTMLLARLTARTTGVPLPVAPPRKHTTHLLQLAERMLAWAAPRGAASAATPIPLDLTFERVYLGGIPSSALAMLVCALLALGAACLVYPLLARQWRSPPQAAPFVDHAKRA